MKVALYTIETLSNLHAGSGDINFGVIDNEVQRDPVSELPVINSSSLKGAFREAFDIDGSKALTEYIFGPDNDSNDSHRTGAYSFFEAQLLSRPVRSNVKAWFSATSPSAIGSFLDMLEDFDIEIDEQAKRQLDELRRLSPAQGRPMIFEAIPNAILEDMETVTNTLDLSAAKSFLGSDIALFNDEDFKKLDLPVIARNSLDNGVSVNLWYEEVVPKKSRFFFCIGKPENIAEADAKKIEGLSNRFDDETQIVQFGANKSIGYGFCKVTKVSR